MAGENTKLEASEVYDRQIRLWGLEAQRRMQESRVLFIGLRALQAEVCKNIVLAGINVALLDDKPVAPVDLAAQFYLSPEHVGINRAEACLPGVQEMNPLAKVECHTTPVSQLPDSFFEQFDVICASDLPPSALVRLDGIARSRGRLFFYADSFGYNGWAIIDLGSHVTRSETDKGKELTFTYPSVEEAFKTPWGSLKDRFGLPKVFIAGRLLGLFEEDYGRRPSGVSPSFSNDVEEFVQHSRKCLAHNDVPADLFSDEELRELARSACVELSPVCAVLGGIIGQEILKAISRKGVPAKNCFLWDGSTNEGRVLAVPK